MPITPYWWFIALYCMALLLLGWIASKRSAESSLKDYYLAGGGLGTFALFFTLYATNYSGGSLFAVPGKAYREGLQVVPLIIGLTGVGVVLLLYAPKLYRIAQRQQFLTLGDFIQWRYEYKPLFYMVNALAVFSLVAYILSNLLAVGILLETATGGALSFSASIIVVSFIMAFYESLGGMRSVVWTDIIQGSLLLIGTWVACTLAFALEPAAPEALMERLDEQRIMLMEGEFPLVTFVSLSIVTMFAACVYPQKIQRIFAAKDLGTTKKAYWIMLFMPVVTLVPLTLVSMSAPAWVEGLEGRDTERVMLYVIAELDGQISWARMLLTLYLAAGIAAIMSTIDSALLTLGSMITNDSIRPRFPQLSQSRLQLIGKALSWILMALMVVASIIIPQSVWSVLIFMLEMMLQLVPAVIVGVWVPSLKGRPVFYGLVVGLLITVGFKLLGGPWAMPLGVHSGLIGFIINLMIIFSGQALLIRSAKQ